MENENLIIEKVAHDLRGVLNKINLINSILIETVSGNKETKQLFLYIDQLCEQGNKITEDLIICCDENNTITLPDKPVSLNDLINQQSIIYKLETEKKRILFRSEIPEEQYLSNIEPYKFIRVLDNLFSNALKFTPSGGEIILVLSGTREKLIIAVKDNGIGIPEKLKEDIFKKYTNARRYGTANESFSGLGLYISKGIIETFKGSLSFRSTENKGSVFFIELGRETGEYPVHY